jgi:hypothetical protein
MDISAPFESLFCECDGCVSLVEISKRDRLLMQKGPLHSEGAAGLRRYLCLWKFVPQSRL